MNHEQMINSAPCHHHRHPNPQDETPQWSGVGTGPLSCACYSWNSQSTITKREAVNLHCISLQHLESKMKVCLDF